jgi:hypothetical protein
LKQLLQEKTLLLNPTRTELPEWNITDASYEEVLLLASARQG